MSKLVNNPITQQILAQVKSIDITLPEAVDDKWAEIEQAEAQLAISVAKLGLRYMDLREAVGHGEFLKSLQERGVAERSVRRYMKVAQFFMDMPDSNRPTLADLKPAQIDVLTSLPETEKQALTPEKIEAYGQMSVRALRAEVKQLRLDFEEAQSTEAENYRLKRKLAEAQQDHAHAITQLNHEQLKKAPETLYGLHPEVAHTRVKAVEIAELLAMAATELNHLVQKATNSAMDHSLQRDCALAVNTSLSGQIMQLNNSLAALHESFSKELLTTPDNLPMYSVEEVHQALMNAEHAKGNYKIAIGAL